MEERVEAPRRVEEVTLWQLAAGVQGLGTPPCSSGAVMYSWTPSGRLMSPISRVTHAEPGETNKAWMCKDPSSARLLPPSCDRRGRS